MMLKIDSVLFVYQKKTKPFSHKFLFHDDEAPGKGWVHTATIDSAIWLEYFMNHPQERETQIKSISL